MTAKRNMRWVPAVLVAVLTVSATALPAAEGAKEKSRHIVLVAGAARSHGYDTHSYRAGCALLAAWLETALGNVRVSTAVGWPEKTAVLESADALVLYCDGLAKHEINGHEGRIRELLDRKVGLGMLHYAVVVEPGTRGNLMLEAIGGYYEPGWSVNPSWTAKFENIPTHEATRGVQPFQIWDEWYFHMRFGPDNGRVTPLLTALPPPSTLKRPDGPHSNNPDVKAAVLDRREEQHVAWVYERPDGGRGFGFTGGHLYWNLAHDDYRKLLLNSIAWIARAPVPSKGIETPTPGLDDMLAELGQPPNRWKREKIEKLLNKFRKQSR